MKTRPIWTITALVLVLLNVLTINYVVYLSSELQEARHGVPQWRHQLPETDKKVMNESLNAVKGNQRRPEHVAIHKHKTATKMHSMAATNVSELHETEVPKTILNRKDLQSTFLRIVLPTVPRKGNPEYLKRVLESFEEQALYASNGEAVLSHNLRLTVYNLRPMVPHPDFEYCKGKYTSDYFEFVELESDSKDIRPGKGHVLKPGLTPDEATRQQTRDIVAMLKHAGRACEYILVNEDDFQFCPASLTTILYLIQKVASSEDFNSIRVSYGMNGILLPCKDIAALSSYLLDQQTMMPVDLLTDEWLTVWHPQAKAHYGNKRRSFFYQNNLLEHLGSISSFSGRGDRPRWGCGQHNKLINSFVPGTEFSVACKGKSDLSPCDLKRPRPILSIVQ